MSVAVVGLSFLCPWENAGIFTDYGLNTAKLKTDSLTNQINDLKNRHQRMQRFISKVEKLDTPFDTFSSEMWLGLADHMTVYSKDKITVTFRCGTDI